MKGSHWEAVCVTELFFFFFTWTRNKALWPQHVSSPGQLNALQVGKKMHLLLPSLASHVNEPLNPLLVFDRVGKELKLLFLSAKERDCTCDAGVLSKSTSRGKIPLRIYTYTVRNAPADMLISWRDVKIAHAQIVGGIIQQSAKGECKSCDSEIRLSLDRSILPHDRQRGRQKLTITFSHCRSSDNAFNDLRICRVDVTPVVQQISWNGVASCTCAGQRHYQRGGFTIQ